MSCRAAGHQSHAPNLAGSPWLARPETQAVFAALTAGGAGARAVGGAVRNALLGLPVKDIDIATTALPDEVMRLAASARLGAHPTGLAHGTVTVVAGHMPFEVTTLRRDVETFGRHATVAFTTDWAEDAARRDFTMNALYCAADGTVHDPLQGYDDLLAHRVRFIGDAHARIREDYLRILRFFRLFAEYGRGEPDGVSLAAAISERHGLGQLSGERLRAELLRLLAAPRAVEAVTVMAAGNVLEVLSAHPAPERLKRLAAIETTLGDAPDAVLRLAALFVDTPADARRIAERLRLSGVEAATLDAVAGTNANDGAFDPGSPETQARANAYRLGADVFRKRGLISWAAGSAAIDDDQRARRLALPERWPPPPLPFSGRDVVALGVPAGPKIGRILADFEAWWIAQDFPRDAGALHDALKRIAAIE